MISNSFRFGPKGSVPESFRPVWELTSFTSADSLRMARMSLAISADFASEIPGGKLARIQMTPSSSWGRNSVPRKLASRKAPATMSAAVATIMLGRPTAQRKQLLILAVNPIQKRVFPGLGFFVEQMGRQHRN